MLLKKSRSVGTIVIFNLIIKTECTPWKNTNNSVLLKMCFKIYNFLTY